MNDKLERGGKGREKESKRERMEQIMPKKDQMMKQKKKHPQQQQRSQRQRLLSIFLKCVSLALTKLMN
jgi:hypothetical protein